MYKMNKKLAPRCVFLCIICILSSMLFLIAACGHQNKLIFDYEIEPREYIRNGWVSLTVTVTNDYGFEHEFISKDSEYKLNVRLCNESNDGYEMPLYISPAYVRWDCEVRDGVWVSSTEWICFKIPSDAPLGKYNLILSYKEQSTEYENVLTVIDGELKFKFNYETDATEFSRGSTVKLSATITNDSGFTYAYFGGSSSFDPYIYLYHENNDGRYVMPMYIPDTDDMGWFRIENGQSRTRFVYFKIPSDAPLGEYNLKLSYLNSSTEYENVLTVTE